jgi:hypothetical protein
MAVTVKQYVQGTHGRCFPLASAWSSLGLAPTVLVTNKKLGSAEFGQLENPLPLGPGPSKAYPANDAQFFTQPDCFKKISSSVVP